GYMRILLLVIAIGPTFAAAAEPVRYQHDIRPILASKCFKCHGPDLKNGGLDLQSYDTATKVLKSGAIAIVPAKVTESELIRRVTAHDPAQRMPQKGEALK